MRAASLVLLLLLPGLAGCTQPGPAPQPGPPLPSSGALAFDGATAFDLVRAQVEKGAPGACEPTSPEVERCPAWRYRIPGTEGNNATAEWIAHTAAGYGFAVRWDAFTAEREGQELPAHNVIATRAGRTNVTVMLVAHYDSRPCADEDPVPANRSQPVLGANDGGSGVAVLLGVARALRNATLNVTLRMAFVDAEDMGDSGHGCGAGTAWAQGAVRDAANLTGEEVRNAKALLLLDLVGDPGLRLPREGASSVGRNRAVQDVVWSLGARLGHAQFLDVQGPFIDDDHVPYIRRGVPSVDIIDLREGSNVFPPSHHTTWDDLAHVSPASLQAVGETVLAALLAWDSEAGA